METCNFDLFTHMLEPKKRSSSVQNSMHLKRLSIAVKGKTTTVLNYEDVMSYKNLHQQDERNYIAIRVFSDRFKEDMVHHTLDREAKLG